MDLAEITDLPDAKARALACHQGIEGRQAEIAELSRVRREALEELIEGGLSGSDIARLLDVSRARISQLMSAGGRPERAFFGGSSRVTVAIGAKQEAGRHDPGDVLSAETFAAFESLAQLARDLGLEAVYEVVPPPGHVSVNRDNLVVMTSPRLLPFLSQIMEADPALRFGVDDRGWYLATTDGQEFRSPRDSGENADYGYLGRLPRPDGKGNFLYLAGVHAQGTMGAAQYLVEHIAALHKDLRGKRFSVAVLAHYDRRQVTSVEAVTPIYRHETAA